MAVQLKDIWRLDHEALEVGDRLALFAGAERFCELRVRNVVCREVGPIELLVVEGPTSLLEDLAGGESASDSKRHPNPTFVFSGTIEENAQMAFSPTHELGLIYRYKVWVTRICRLQDDVVNVPSPCIEVPEVQEA